jgi:cobalamin biosynthesis protein CobD/CbiB
VVILKEGAKKIIMSSYHKKFIGMNKHIDIGSLIIILITFFLFIIALFVKGLTKELLLEAGVLLVSIKLIMMAQKNSAISNEISKDLEEIKKMIKAASE